MIDEERDLGVLVSGDLKVESQCVKASKVANKILGLIKMLCSSDNGGYHTPVQTKGEAAFKLMCTGLQAAFSEGQGITRGSAAQGNEVR